MSKKDPKKVAEDFISSVSEIKELVNIAGLSQKRVTWVHEYAIIRLFREFKIMILNCLVAAINRDNFELPKKERIDSPKHLNVGVCECAIVGNGYSNFRRRHGLIGKLKRFVPDDHYLFEIANKNDYKVSLNRFSASRNFAAYDSKPSKNAALEAAGENDHPLRRMASPGVWLKTKGRFERFCDQLKQLAQELKDKSSNQD